MIESQPITLGEPVPPARATSASDELDLLRAELEVSMGLAGMPNVASIDRNLVRLPWEQ